MTLQPLPQAAADSPAIPYAGAPSYATAPTSVVVLGWLGIALGALGLICKPTSLLVFVVKMPVQHPVVEAMRNDSFVRGWMVISVGTGWMISLLLVLASVGALRLRDWGRVGMLAYAGLALVMTVLSQIVGVLAITPALAPAMRQAAAASPSPFQPGPGASMAIGIVLGIWFPALILYYFTRRRVKQAFEQGPAPAGAKI